MSGTGPIAQDWEPVVLRKKAPTSASKKDERAVNAARRSGAEIETLKKSNAGTNKAASSSTTLNTRKLDDENENLTQSTSSSTSNPSASSQYMYPASSYFPLPFHLQNADPAVQQMYLPPSQFPPSVKIPGVAPTFTVPAPVATGMYSLPQFQQAQQLFQRDAQTITPEALESVKAALASSEVEHKSETKKKAIPRKAAGQSWEDPTLSDWPENDFRLFCGDLGNEVNDDVLSKSFSRFPSFNMARVVRDKRTGKTKGYGFVSFSNPSDLAAAIKEMNGKYVGNRPIKLRKSTWKERTDADALERQKNHIQKKPKLQKKGILHK